MSDFGKYGGDAIRVVRTSEVEHPLANVRRLMAKYGATPELIEEAVDAHERGRVNLREISEEDLEAHVAALLEGTDVAWVAADRSSIDAARRDPELWAECNTMDVRGKRGVIGGSVGSVMMWVGQDRIADAGKAVVADYAELARAEEEGRPVRSSLIKLLRLVHGQGELPPMIET